MTWSDNSTNEVNFILQRAGDPAFTVGVVNTTLAANRISYNLTGLYRGVVYYFRIRAANKGGYSGWSNVVRIVTP